MGHKAFKQHYEIEHLVHVVDGNIHIGSSYVTDLIVVGKDGVIIKDHNDRFFSNEKLMRYQLEINGDPQKAAELIACEDKFDRDLPVWTYHDMEVVEDKCEQYGWPNVTHRGTLMYEGLHFKTREEAIKCMLDRAQGEIRFHARQLEEAKKKLKEDEKFLFEQQDKLAAMVEKYGKEIYLSHG